RRTGSTHVEMLRRALANPLRPGQPQYGAAVEWWHPGDGFGSGRVAAVARSLVTATLAYESARNAYGRVVTAGTGSVPARAALWAARKSLSAAEERYRSLSTEADAFAVEEVVRARWQAPQRDWRTRGAVPPLRVPSGYQLTRTESGLHIRR